MKQQKKRQLKKHYPYRYVSGGLSSFLVACGAAPLVPSVTKDKRRVTCGNCNSILKRRDVEKMKRCKA